MVPTARFELATSSLPVRDSTLNYAGKEWWRKQGTILQPSPYGGAALPIELHRHEMVVPPEFESGLRKSKFPVLTSYTKGQ